jgi:CRISPR-associated protein Csd2
MSWEKYVPEDIKDIYEVHDYKHAAAILSVEFPKEFHEICEALRKFRFKKSDILAAGGNESHIPKIFSDILRPLEWNEKNLSAELNVFEKKGKSSILKSTFSHGSHMVDYLKGRVAFDLKWNSKDQTFDRDLYAFKAFFEYDAISVGILVTRIMNLTLFSRNLESMQNMAPVRLTWGN